MTRTSGLSPRQSSRLTHTFWCQSQYLTATARIWRQTFGKCSSPNRLGPLKKRRRITWMRWNFSKRQVVVGETVGKMLYEWSAWLTSWLRIVSVCAYRNLLKWSTFWRRPKIMMGWPMINSWVCFLWWWSLVCFDEIIKACTQVNNSSSARRESESSIKT